MGDRLGYILLVNLILNCLFFYRRFNGERRSLFLGLSFLFTFVSLALLMLLIMVNLEDYSLVRWLLYLLALVLALVFLTFPLVLVFTLIFTGIRVIRKEGGGLAHYLSLGLGILYLLYLVFWPVIGRLATSSLASLVYYYLSFVFLSMVFVFILYSLTNLLNLIRRPGKAYEAVVVLGSGLRHGFEVPPLLGARVDRGIEAHRENPASLLVLSGGKGSDEALAEAQAMASYSIERGVDPDKIIIEDRSTNTRENLVFSRTLIEERLGKNRSLLVVTTSYHLLRALLLARELGIDCDGRGSKTRLYYSINAFIREWIAFIVLKRKAFLVFFSLSLLLFLLGFRFLLPFLL